MSCHSSSLFNKGSSKWLFPFFVCVAKQYFWVTLVFYFQFSSIKYHHFTFFSIYLLNSFEIRQAATYLYTDFLGGGVMWNRYQAVPITDIPVNSPDASLMHFWAFRFLKSPLFKHRLTTLLGLYEVDQKKWAKVHLQNYTMYYHGNYTGPFRLRITKLNINTNNLFKIVV